MASNVVVDPRAVASEHAFIDWFMEIDAEAIDATDESCDLFFCKGAHHHFPRPPEAPLE